MHSVPLLCLTRNFAPAQMLTVTLHGGLVSDTFHAGMRLVFQRLAGVRR